MPQPQPQPQPQPHHDRITLEELCGMGSSKQVSAWLCEHGLEQRASELIAQRLPALVGEFKREAAILERLEKNLQKWVQKRGEVDAARQELPHRGLCSDEPGLEGGVCQAAGLSAGGIGLGGGSALSFWGASAACSVGTCGCGCLGCLAGVSFLALGILGVFSFLASPKLLLDGMANDQKDKQKLRLLLGELCKLDTASVNACRELLDINEKRRVFAGENDISFDEILRLCELTSDRPRLIQHLLEASVRLGDPTIAKTMLELGADMDQKNEDGKTPLDAAIYAQQHDMIQLLLQRGARFAPADEGQALDMLVQDPLLRRRIAATTTLGQQPTLENLHAFLQDKQWTIIREVLASDEIRCTVAAEDIVFALENRGPLNVLEVLVRQEVVASPDGRRVPLDVFARLLTDGRWTAASLVLPVLDPLPHDSLVLMALIERRAPLELIEAMLRRGANPNALSEERGTILHAALEQRPARRMAIVELLCAHGADPHTIYNGNDYDTAFAIAERRNMNDVAAYFRKNFGSLGRRSA